MVGLLTNTLKVLYNQYWNFYGRKGSSYLRFFVSNQNLSLVYIYFIIHKQFWRVFDNQIFSKWDI